MILSVTLTPVAPDDADLRLFAPEYRALVVGVVGIVVAVAFEAIAVATAMPVAARELHGLRGYGLAFSVFLTTSLLGMVVAGEMSDRRGPVRPFIVAAVSFALGLLVAGLATSMWVLVVARAVQGFGAGLNIVSLYVVVGRAFPAGLRPRVFSAISSGWILPSLIGPPVAGLLADHLSWRWVFLGVLPLLVGAALLVGRTWAGWTGRPRSARATPRRSRLGAAVLAAVGAGLLQFAGQLLKGHPAPAVLLVVAGLVLLGARRAAAAAGRRLPARPRPADGRGPPWSARRRLLRGRDVHPAHARRAAVAGHDPGRRLADRCGADLVARRLAAGPAWAADAALRCW